MNTQNPLRNTLIMGNLTITGWSARKKEKRVEKKAEAEAGAVDGAISARKALLPGAKALEAITNYAAGTRGWWISVSREWMASARVYHAAKHFEIQTEVGDRQRHYYTLVDAFMAEYPALRADAQFQLNHLFDPSEYPDPSDVRRKFRFDFEVMPMPAGEDIRLLDNVIPADEVERLVFEAEARTEAKLRDAMNATYAELKDVVYKFVERMNARNASEDEEGVEVNGRKKKAAPIYDSVLENILDVVDRMPGLNLAGDQKLTDLAKQAYDLANMFTVDELKDSRASRILATQKAQSIAEQFAGMFD